MTADPFDREVTDPDRDILVHPDELTLGVLGGCIACATGCALWFTRWGRGREVAVHERHACRATASGLLTAALSASAGEAPAQASSARRRGRGVYARGEQVAEAPRETVSVLGPGPDLAGTASRFYVPGRCPTPWVVLGPRGIVPCRHEETARDTAVLFVVAGAAAVTVVDPDDHETVITG